MTASIQKTHLKSRRVFQCFFLTLNVFQFTQSQSKSILCYHQIKQKQNHFLHPKQFANNFNSAFPYSYTYSSNSERTQMLLYSIISHFSQSYPSLCVQVHFISVQATSSITSPLYAKNPDSLKLNYNTNFQNKWINKTGLILPHTFSNFTSQLPKTSLWWWGAGISKQCVCENLKKGIYNRNWKDLCCLPTLRDGDKPADISNPPTCYCSFLHSFSCDIIFTHP